jgi:hypothetical protein
LCYDTICRWQRLSNHSAVDDKQRAAQISEMATMSKLPQTDSIEELAAFWETHDLTDYEDELVEVSSPFVQREPAIVLHLEPEETRKLSVLAERTGRTTEALVQQWVREQLRVAVAS